MDWQEVAWHEVGDDLQVVMVAQGDDGIVVRQDVSGPLAQVAYGEPWRSLRVRLDGAATAALLEGRGLVGRGGLWELLSSPEGGVLDLMDACDDAGIPYAFASMGPGGDIQFRPAPATGVASDGE